MAGQTFIPRGCPVKELAKKAAQIELSSAVALWLAFIGANMACLGIMALLLIW
jgi:hypothetical protein